MKQNMGSLDRFGRASLALVIAVLYLTKVISGPAALILGGIALIFFATSLIGFCPIYKAFKWNTLPKPVEKFYLWGKGPSAK